VTRQQRAQLLARVQEQLAVFEAASSGGTWDGETYVPPIVLSRERLQAVRDVLWDVEAWLERRSRW
jgi:hypothetical protein